MREYTHWSMNERQSLYMYLEMRLSVEIISQKLSRDRSTIYREINRNKELEKYLPGVANQKALLRASNGRISKLQKGQLRLIREHALVIGKEIRFSLLVIERKLSQH